MAFTFNISHLIGKFSTEGEQITPALYFLDFSVKIRHFETTFVFVPKTRPGNIGVNLLDYEGEPSKFDLDPLLTTKDMGLKIKFCNTNTILNKDLATVKFRGKQTRKDLLRWLPKFSLYKFTHGSLSDPGIFGSPNLDQFLFVIKVYRPYAAVGRPEDIRIQQEIVMRGHHTLKQLEGAIECPLDYVGLEDVSQNPSHLTDARTFTKIEKAKYPGYFFYIENNFYVNEPGNSDMSAVAIKFLKKNGVEQCFKAQCDGALMNLPLRVGRPYLYQHLGQCEHVIMISDVRFRCSDDFTGPKGPNYPTVRAISNMAPKQCLLCAHAYARWLVTNFYKLTMARAFLCTRCFVSFCYVNGRKAGEFQAYQYLDPLLIL